MKMIVLVSLLFSFSSFAKEMNFSCKATYNMETVLDTKATLGEQKVNFGGFDNFNYSLSQQADGKIELQSYDVSEPSRSYAVASVKNPGDYVELSIWNRNFVMGVRCTLHN